MASFSFSKPCRHAACHITHHVRILRVSFPSCHTLCLSPCIHEHPFGYLHDLHGVALGILQLPDHALLQVQPPR